MGDNVSLAAHRAFEAAKRQVQTSLQGFGSGHSGYMAVGVGREKFLDWAAAYNLAHMDDISGLAFEEKNGLTVARFDTCEKYPGMSREIMEAFPDAIVYGFSDWEDATAEVNGSIINASDGPLCVVTLDNCFEEEGCIRIDMRFTDKASGSSFVIGGYFDFASRERMRTRWGNESFSYLYDLLDAYGISAVERNLKACELRLVG